jgi:hypothetical protein
MHNNGTVNNWVKYIETNLNDIGLSNVWVTQAQGINKMRFKNSIKERLLDQNKQKWAAKIEESSKCCNYKI